MENKQLTDRQLFGMLCDQVLEKHFQDQSNFEVMDCRCRRSHYKKLSQIIGSPVTGPTIFPKKLLIAILAAAIILLAGCTALIYGEQIEGLITNFFEDHVLVTTDADQEKQEIEEIYYLEYVPEGFSMVSESYCSNRVYYSFENTNGAYITFYQYSDIGARINTENASTQTLQLADKTIYCQNKSEKTVYLWCENGYLMQLTIDGKISEEDALSVIQCVSPKQF